MFKVALQYFFNVFVLFNIVLNLKLLKFVPKMRILKTWKIFGIPGKIFEKMSGNPI